VSINLRTGSGRTVALESGAASAVTARQAINSHPASFGNVIGLKLNPVFAARQPLKNVPESP
jgi:hypothetical protein